MRFWDSSALVPLLVEEDVSDGMEGHLANDPVAAVWWGSRVECFAAIARREREGLIAGAESARGEAKLSELSEQWVEIPPTEPVRELATRLLRLHALRAGDALQLAAATVARDGEQLPFVTLDDRLAAAARREGFPVLP